MDRPRHVLLLALLILSAGAGIAAGQAPVARVTGTVRDDGGKPVPGATITATNPDQAPTTFTATTDEKGRFGILGLRRGAWAFAIAAPGFQTARVERQRPDQPPEPAPHHQAARGCRAAAGPTATFTGPEIQTLIDAAETAAGAGDLAAAVSGYRDLLAKIPALTTAYLRIGALLEQKGDTAGALEAYRELARVEPDNARAAAAIARLARTPQ